MAGVQMAGRDARGNVFANITYYISAGENGTIVDAPVNHFQVTQQPSPIYEVRIKEPLYVPEGPALAFLNGLAGRVESFLDGLEIAIQSVP